jgi:hypothetical protein
MDIFGDLSSVQQRTFANILVRASFIAIFRAAEFAIMSHIL